MVRQARTYFVGAISGVTLIGVAIAVFVVLVSAQVFKDWPIAALGGGNDKAAVSDADPVTGPADSAAAAPKVTLPASAGANAANAAGGPGRTAAKAHGNQHAAGPPQAAVSPSDVPVAPVASSEPASSSPESGGNPASPAPSQGSKPASSSPAPSTPPSNPTGTSSGGGNNGTGTTSTPPVKTPSVPSTPPSATVTGTVNGAVNGVDETVTGGALKETGVTGVTEGVVNGVAGPESTVGKVADETVGAVGGLLGGKK